ncbi:hypothetical protein [Celeribacter neptunius]|uniref:Hemoglobin-like flavoprotein n=1 Tax=Celeribacter neptunius TaxID=588602 RepID=A0A1I3QUV3_9RHOB|nr:hypothetical protein [Celeribacter neptunius]SFJ37041.1 Hemoglobin-like flavoprotein [Celeribacter neptunius]
MITIKQISMVRNSFRQLAPRRDEIFLGVYQRLANASPEFETLYGIDLGQRARTLDGIVELALLSLDHPTALFGTLHGLGRQYANYGSWRDTHDLLAEFLIDSFAEHSGESWTLEHSEAWRRVLQFIIQGMLDGAKSAAVA